MVGQVDEAKGEDVKGVEVIRYVCLGMNRAQ